MIGDVVEVAGSASRWVLHSPINLPAPGWRMWRREGSQIVEHIAASSEITLVASRPSYTAGQRLAFGPSEWGELVSDDGDTVTLRASNREPAGSIGFTSWEGDRVISKCVLVLFNP